MNEHCDYCDSLVYTVELLGTPPYVVEIKVCKRHSLTVKEDA